MNDRKLFRKIREFEKKLFYWAPYFTIQHVYITRKGLEFDILTLIPGDYHTIRGGFKWKKEIKYNDHTEKI